MIAVVIVPPTAVGHLPHAAAVIVLCALALCALWLIWLGLQLFGPSRRR